MSTPNEKSPVVAPWIWLVIVVWIGFGIFVRLAFGGWDAGGSFGDAFGALNTLFTGLAFAFLVYTAALQRRELEMQRDELRYTRQEFERQTQNQKDHLQLLKEEREGRLKLLEAESSPNLLFRVNGQPRVDEMSARLVNAGAAICDLRILETKGSKIAKVRLKDNTILNRNAEVGLEIHMVGDFSEGSADVEFTLGFVDVLLQRRAITFNARLTPWDSRGD